MRAPRDLLRRRMHLMRKRAELLAHVQKTNSQYNLPEIGKNIAYQANRDGVAERFPDLAVQKTIAVDLGLIEDYDRLLTDLELSIVKMAKQYDANTFYRLRSIPGVGKMLALILLYGIHALQRFPRVQVKTIILYHRWLLTPSGPKQEKPPHNSIRLTHHRRLLALAREDRRG